METVAECGYVAIDLYDGSLMYDFKQDRLTICDIDLFAKVLCTQWIRSVKTGIKVYGSLSGSGILHLKSFPRNGILYKNFLKEISKCSIPFLLSADDKSLCS